MRSYLVVFGALTIAGGIVGFVKAKSRASILAGSIAGLLLLASGYLVGIGERVGLILGLVVSFALTARFVMVFRTRRKLMPAGLMTALGILGVVLTTLALLKIAQP